MADFAWPSWWPANPVGSAYDAAQENKKALMLILYVALALGCLLLAIYIWRKIE